MWILLSILALIYLILLLPVHLFIQYDETGKLDVGARFLGKTFSPSESKSAPKKPSKGENPLVKLLKELTGIHRLDQEPKKESAQDENFLQKLEENFSLILGLIKRVLGLLKRFRITTLHLHLICAHPDAAEAAIAYGRYCTAVYSFLNILRSLVYVRKKGEDIRIGCDFNETKSSCTFEITLSLGIHRILGAFLRILWDEAKRRIKAKN